MKTMRFFLIVLVLSVSSLACRIPGLGNHEPTTAPPVEVPVVPQATEEMPAPTETAKPTAEPVSDLTCTSIPSFEICMPQELASALVASKMPKVEDNGMVGPWEIIPEHYQIVPNGYPLTNTFLKPIIHVIPAADYAIMTESALMTQNYLMELMASRDPKPSSLPILPIINAGSVFTARIGYVENEYLHGVEGLTQLAQSYSVINNNELIYTFQGITNDEKYWIGIILPISQNSLPADQSGNPYSDLDQLMNQYQTYTSVISDTLTNAPSDSFTPNYADIQKVVESIQYIP